MVDPSPIEELDCTSNGSTVSPDGQGQIQTQISRAPPPPPRPACPRPRRGGARAARTPARRCAGGRCEARLRSDVGRRPGQSGGCLAQRLLQELQRQAGLLRHRPRGWARAALRDSLLALRHRHHGTLLRPAAPGLPSGSIPTPEVEGVIVGGIASRVASEVLQGRGDQLRDLKEPLVEYVLAFYRLAEPGPEPGKVVPLEQEQEAAPEYLEARRRQAGASTRLLRPDRRVSLFLLWGAKNFLHKYL